MTKLIVAAKRRTAAIIAPTVQLARSLVEKADLKCKLSEKQRLYAQMLKDKIDGPVLEETSREIEALTLKLYCNVAHRKQ